MSQPTGKDLKGLMEAYASIYKQEEVVVEQEIHQEQFEINEEVLYESMIVYLVEFGYASTEKQAVNMLPHLSERWATNIAVEIIINETFVDSVNLLVDEGYDLSSHTWEELYEQYVENLNNILIQEGVENLHEALPLLIPAGAAMAPFAKAALLGGALYAGKKALDAYQNLRGRTSPEGERFLNAPLPTTKPKVKPTTVVKSQSGDVNLDKPSPNVPPGYNPPLPGQNVRLNQSTAKSPAVAATGGGGGSGQPPEDPNKNKEKEKSNFRGDLRDKIRQQQQQQQQRMNQQQQQQRNTNRFFKSLQRYNQSPGRQGSDIGTTLGRLRTGAAALKNFFIGKTLAGGLTRSAAVGSGIVGDEIVNVGSGRERLSQGLQTALLQSRTQGEKDKERIRARGTRERDDYLRSQQQGPAQRPLIRNAQGQVIGLGGGN